MTDDDAQKRKQEAATIRLENQIREANRLRYEREKQQPTTLLEHRTRDAKERRRRHGPKPKIGEELPSGGVVYDDVLPLAAKDALEQGAIPYVGFDFDFRDL